MRKLLAHLSYANVTATIALFIALGGGAYAAFKLPRNSVGAAQLKKGAVTPPKVAKSTIALFRGQPGATGAQGERGPQGPIGLQGPPGAPGSARAYAFVNVVSPSAPVLDPNRTKNITAVTRMGSSTKGQFCLTLAPGIDASTVAPVATAYWINAFATSNLPEAAIDPSSDCGSGQIGVVTWSGTSLTDEHFFVVIP